MRRKINVIDVVEVADWPCVKARDDEQTAKIAVREFEIAHLRMLLREALAQLRRHHEVTKSTSVDYQRLVKRADAALEVEHG